MTNPIVKQDKEKVLEIIRSEHFQLSPEIKAQTFEAVSVLFKQLRQPEQEEIKKLLAARLNWPIERIAPTLRLASQVDLRRAVQWQPRQPTRAQDETLYPTEGWIGGYLLYAQENEAPLAWHFWSAVTLLGAACQRHVYLDRGAYTIWPNYYTVFIGPSGSGKTTTIAMAVDILKRTNAILEDDDEWPADRRIRILPETVTPLSLLAELQTGRVYDTVKGQVLNERWKSSIGFLANDELTTLLGRANFQSARLVQILTALYQCPDRWKDAANIRGELELRDVAFSMLLGSAPEWIRDEVSDAMLKGGFMNRLHFSYRERRSMDMSKPGVNDPVVAEILASKLVDLIKAPFASMTLTDEAEFWFNSWYRSMKEKLEKEVDVGLVNSYTRKPVHILKLSMILAISKDVRNRVIHKEDLELALALLNQEEAYLPKMFEFFQATPESLREDFVLETIRRYGTWMARKEIGRACYKKVSGAQGLDRILKSLKRRGAVEYTVGKWRQGFYRALPRSPLRR